MSSSKNSDTAKTPGPYDCFCPPRDRSTGLRDQKAAVLSLPLKAIHTAFLPKRNRAYRPPVFYLGYLVNDDWVKEYAKEKGIYKTMWLDGKEVWNESETRDCVLKSIPKDLEITSFAPYYSHVAYFPSMKSKDAWLLTVYSNYRGRQRRAPSKDDIEKLRKCLGEPEKPKWYLSAAEWFWGPRPYYYEAGICET